MEWTIRFHADVLKDLDRLGKGPAAVIVNHLKNLVKRKGFEKKGLSWATEGFLRFEHTPYQIVTYVDMANRIFLVLSVRDEEGTYIAEKNKNPARGLGFLI